MGQLAALEREALDQLRRGDLRGAYGTLTLLCELRPDDPELKRRRSQVQVLLERRSETRARMEAEPLRFAHAYIKAGRMGEGLRLLRAALARDPDNARLRDLALQVAKRLRAIEEAQVPAARTERQAAENELRAQSEARQVRRRVPEQNGAQPAAMGLVSNHPAPAASQRPPAPRPASLANGIAPRGTGVAAVAAKTPVRRPHASASLERLRSLLETVRARRRAPSQWLDADDASSHERTYEQDVFQE